MTPHFTATVANGSAPGTDYTKDFAIRVYAPKLTGTVSITGTAAVGQTLTADMESAMTGVVEEMSGETLWAKSVTGGGATSLFTGVSADSSGNVYAVGRQGGTGT
jgi:hypothetical protein